MEWPLCHSPLPGPSQLLSGLIIGSSSVSPSRFHSCKHNQFCHLGLVGSSIQPALRLLFSLLLLAFPTVHISKVIFSQLLAALAFPKLQLCRLRSVEQLAPPTGRGIHLANHCVGSLLDWYPFSVGLSAQDFVVAEPRNVRLRTAG